MSVRRHKKLLKVFIRIVAIGTLILGWNFSAKNLPAGFVTEGVQLRVEIDGLDFGRFDQSGRLDILDSIIEYSNDSYFRVKLQRHFVTDPSIYLWAKNNIAYHYGLKNIHLIKQNSFGDEISRYVLKFCQPLSWSIETSNTTLGGFHESVELAVQEIEIN